MVLSAYGSILSSLTMEVIVYVLLVVKEKGMIFVLVGVYYKINPYNNVPDHFLQKFHYKNLS